MSREPASNCKKKSSCLAFLIPVVIWQQVFLWGLFLKPIEKFYKNYRGRRMKLYTQAITLDHHFTQKVVEIGTLGPIIHRNTCTDGVQLLVARACAPAFPTLATPLVKSVYVCARPLYIRCWSFTCPSSLLLITVFNHYSTLNCLCESVHTESSGCLASFRGPTQLFVACKQWKASGSEASECYPRHVHAAVLNKTCTW